MVPRAVRGGDHNARVTGTAPLRLRRTFDAAAERYDRARPKYPPAIFEDLAELSGLEPGSSVLEIGCGTGHATVPLAERGYRIVAVELGAALAKVARRRLAPYPDAQVIVADFEDWKLPAQPFDAVVSATAFHWISPEIRVQKAAAALRAGGSLAIIETRRSPLGTRRFLANLRRCHQRWEGTEAPIRKPGADEPAESLSAIVQSGLFERVTTRRYAWEHEFSAAGYIELLMTFSNVLSLDRAHQSGLLECVGGLIDRELDGRVREANVNKLVVAQALPSRSLP